MPFIEFRVLSRPLSCTCNQGDGCCTGWDSTVRKLAQHSSKQLGMVDTTHVDAWLQKVALVSEDSNYNFGTSADAPPCTFATMTVMMLPPTKVCSLHQTSLYLYSVTAPQGQGALVADCAHLR